MSALVLKLNAHFFFVTLPFGIVTADDIFEPMEEEGEKELQREGGGETLSRGDGRISSEA